MNPNCIPNPYPILTGKQYVRDRFEDANVYRGWRGGQRHTTDENTTTDSVITKLRSRVSGESDKTNTYVYVGKEDRFVHGLDITHTHTNMYTYIHTYIQVCESRS